MLAIVTTHPIQYQTPIWLALAKDGSVPFEVWYLTDHGMRPSLDQEFGKTFAWDIETLYGYPYRLLTTARRASPTSFWHCRLVERLEDRVRRSGVKAVWIQGWQVAAYWQAVRHAKAAGAEAWLRAESNDLAPKPAWKRPLRRLLLRRLFAAVDRFLYIGSANKRLYQDFGIPDTRLYAAPYSVDNDRFARQAAELRPRRRELRRRLGIADDDFCVLFCGKLIPKKRPRDLVLAAQRLRSDGRLRNIHLLFVGTGKLGEDLRRSCDVAVDFDQDRLSPPTVAGSQLRNGSERPLASFAGFLNQTEISRAYVAADCLVLPSDHGETWGIVVNEAMASGLPCMVSRACGCAEDLAGDEFSFSLGDVDALADKLATVHASRPCPPSRALPGIEDSVSAIKRAYFDLRSQRDGARARLEQSYPPGAGAHHAE
jgi:glycosyltransferase involved in cell wall biosynthesis